MSVRFFLANFFTKCRGHGGPEPSSHIYCDVLWQCVVCSMPDNFVICVGLC